MTRIRRVNEACALQPGLYWPNQYDNPANALAHEKTTGPEILSAVPDVAEVYCAVGTGGTAAGVGRFFRCVRPVTRVIGCDVVGSVTFGGPPGKRFISGPGNSFVPGNYDRSVLHDTVYVPEPEAVAMCRWLARSHGLLVGGSTGMALAGVLRRGDAGKEGPVVVISPDMGEKYLDQVWNDRWVEERYSLAAVEAAAQRMGLA